MKSLCLSQGYVTFVDDADYEVLARWKWCVGFSGDTAYAKRAGQDGRQVFMHRQILGLVPGDGKVVDHISGDALDNRRRNLRLVTKQQNSQNMHRRALGTSRFRGVYFNTAHRKWMARVKINYRHHYLGTFDDEVQAARVAEAYRQQHMPFAAPDLELLILDERLGMEREAA